MARKTGLSKPDVAPETSTAHKGGKRGPRKVSYAIDIGAHKDAIDRLAALYGKDPATVVEDLTTLYMKNSLSPHFAKLQSGYAQERREKEEVALREIAPLAEDGDRDMTSNREPESIPAEDDAHA